MLFLVSIHESTQECRYLTSSFIVIPVQLRCYLWNYADYKILNRLLEISKIIYVFCKVYFHSEKVKAEKHLST